jgi:hypothetical protein
MQVVGGVSGKCLAQPAASAAVWSTAYDELLQAFKRADFDVALIYAIGDVARAARDGRPTRGAVREACRAFGEYAVRQDSFEDRPRQAL